MNWSEWYPFPDPKNLGCLTAPTGPGVYELINTKTGKKVLFGESKCAALRMTSLLPVSHGGAGTRNNPDKRDYVAKNLKHLEYRTLACKTKEESRAEERKLNKSEYEFKT